ncbi:unnamed protein product [Dibothriocephalus latus]|uniref:Uncharacterized protein n=1 Tax=Dibothriocephalus latus TaxID=60516 RepID=A0A3P7PUD5_DIBLA|nr:unnamed protein product [Dibothriocephalus latus]
MAGSPQREKVADADATEQQQKEEEGAGAGSPCVDEEWLYFYMLTNLESYADWVMRIVSCYQHTADVLQAAGAKYPRKIVVYNKLPYLAVEAVEVFYRAHAFALKVLLRTGKPQSNSSCKLPLVELADALLKFSQSAFVIEPGKNGYVRLMSFVSPPKLDCIMKGNLATHTNFAPFKDTFALSST